MCAAQRLVLSCIENKRNAVKRKSITTFANSPAGGGWCASIDHDLLMSSTATPPAMNSSSSFQSEPRQLRQLCCPPGRRLHATASDKAQSSKGPKLVLVHNIEKAPVESPSQVRFPNATYYKKQCRLVETNVTKTDIVENLSSDSESSLDSPEKNAKKSVTSYIEETETNPLPNRLKVTLEAPSPVEGTSTKKKYISGGLAERLNKLCRRMDSERSVRDYNRTLTQSEHNSAENFQFILLHLLEQGDYLCLYCATYHLPAGDTCASSPRFVHLLVRFENETHGNHRTLYDQLLAQPLPCVIALFKECCYASVTDKIIVCDPGDMRLLRDVSPPTKSLGWQQCDPTSIRCETCRKFDRNGPSFMVTSNPAPVKVPPVPPPNFNIPPVSRPGKESCVQNSLSWGVSNQQSYPMSQLPSSPSFCRQRCSPVVTPPTSPPILPTKATSSTIPPPVRKPQFTTDCYLVVWKFSFWENTRLRSCGVLLQFQGQLALVFFTAAAYAKLDQGSVYHLDTLVALPPSEYMAGLKFCAQITAALLTPQCSSSARYEILRFGCLSSTSSNGLAAALYDGRFCSFLSSSCLATLGLHWMFPLIEDVISDSSSPLPPSLSLLQRFSMKGLFLTADLTSPQRLYLLPRGQLSASTVCFSSESVFPFHEHDREQWENDSAFVCLSGLRQHGSSGDLMYDEFGSLIACEKGYRLPTLVVHDLEKKGEPAAQFPPKLSLVKATFQIVGVVVEESFQVALCRVCWIGTQPQDAATSPVICARCETRDPGTLMLQVVVWVRPVAAPLRDLRKQWKMKLHRSTVDKLLPVDEGVVKKMKSAALLGHNLEGCVSLLVSEPNVEVLTLVQLHPNLYPNQG